MFSLRSIALGALMLLPILAISQHTVGLIDYVPGAVSDGYMLFFPGAQETVYMVDNCGQIVHKWDDSVLLPGNGFRFVENGDLVRTGREAGPGNLAFPGGGGGQYVQRKDWDNNILWQFEYSSDSVRMHHDLTVLPNGNVLLIAWEYRSIEDAWAAGRDTVGSGLNALWPEQIVEIQPIGADSGAVVWEWHVWDHLVQDFDQGLGNFGVVGDHPELVDLNYDEEGISDWLHINGIDYNAELDQIMLSVPHFNELWIIDHSTTSAEAATHSGGNSGKGGDLLYRWGNPQTYRQGTIADKQLFFCHNAHWLGGELPVSDPDHGRIMVFNNQLGAAHSAVDIIQQPAVDANGNYAYTPGTAYGPSTYSSRYMATPPTAFYSSGLGSAQKLPDGNTLICSGREGRIFQIDENDADVWTYENPFFQGAPLPQGGDPFQNNQLFMALWLSPSHPGLIGRDLTPQGFIELEPDTFFCDLTMGVSGAERSIPGIGLEGNVVAQQLFVHTDFAGTFLIMDALGRSVQEVRLASGRNVVVVDDLVPGMYLITSVGTTGNGVRFQVIAN